VTLGQNATVAIAAGVRTLTVSVTGLAKDDHVIITPKTPVPAGYLVGHPTARAAGVLDVPIYAPAMIINASYSFTARVLALRPGT
jgi:hypothetical protein